ncbi:exoribonuclease II [Gammaproteobacteria bacterium]
MNLLIANVPTRGQILDLLENNQVVAAVCLEERKGKLRLLTESGREINAASKQVVHLHDLYLDTDQAREALTRVLQIRAVRREALVAEVDIPGLWEVLKDETRHFAAIELAELAFGEGNDDQIAAVLHALYRERIHFRGRGDTGFRPTDAATVAAVLIQRAREEEKVTRARRVSDWLRAACDGQLLPIPPEGTEIIEMLKDLALNGEESRSRERLREIFRVAKLDEKEAPFQLLVRLGVWDPDENLMLLRLDTRRVLPDKVEKEARILADATNWSWQKDPRLDLRELTVYTVDSASTLDVDDALSLTVVPGGFEVGIHITDVSAVIRRDSLLDGEARLRGTSIYLPDLYIPMLPTVISEDLCSLTEGVLRPAISLFVTVDTAGAVRARRFAFTVLRVIRRTYKEVDALLASDEKSPWHTFLAIAQSWRAERWARGALFLTFPELTVTVATDGKVNVEREECETGARILVSEMMIQANRLSAAVMKEAEVPCIYRGQTAPRERLFEGVVPDDLWLNYRQRMQLSRAEVGIEPIVHHGLGVESYATISSPLRRYADLVNQRQFAAFLRGEPLPYTMLELKAILSAIERPVSQSSLLEQNRRRYWLLRLLEQRRGLETDALVVAIHGQRIQIVLPEFMLETTLPATTYFSLQPGQWLRVEITRANALEDILRVEIVNQPTLVHEQVEIESDRLDRYNQRTKKNVIEQADGIERTSSRSSQA